MSFRPQIRETGEYWSAWLLNQPRNMKRAALIAMDFALLSAVLWTAMSIRHGELYVPEKPGGLVLLIAGPAITVATFWWSGLYRLVTRYISYRGTLQIFLTVCFSVLVWSLFVFMSGQLGVPRSSIIAYAFAAAAVIALSRQAIGVFLKSAGLPSRARLPGQRKKDVIIYGAGQMGVQLLQSLKRAGDREAIAFVDLSPSMWGQYLNGLKVYRPEKLESLLRRTEAKEVLVALPGTLRRERRQILQDLERLAVDVKVLPAFEDFTSGRVGIQDLRPVDVGDLLGRDPVQPSLELLARNTKGKSILVTGAGGSIGSELVRQILKQVPRRLVLFDLSEVALYEIEMEVLEWVEKLGPEVAKPEIKAVLGSVLDRPLVMDALRTFGVETIYHAAAYKHVPIVEHNPIVGLGNNVFGAKTVADCALETGVERMVLISTDKAVRPTNVMGASKRLAELVLQAAASTKPETVFTMVRFGNVLDSSGSVVRRFRKQIAAGGPVTVTHPDVERYFMSIPEAAELVIQAGAMAKGGEVFVLQMGEPVKIDDLARLMIRLSGVEIRDDETPDGDIAVVYTGLRPGEKLYEELLIGANTTSTEHSRIWKSDEPCLPPDDLERELDTLKAGMSSRDYTAIHSVLLRTVEGYRPEGDASVVGESGGAAAWAYASRTLH